MLPIPFLQYSTTSTSPSYNPPPVTPMFWFDPSLGDMSTERMGNLSNLKSTFVYPSTLNGLMVASSSTNASANYATGSNGSLTTTIFMVCSGTPSFSYWYDPIPGDTGPGGGGSYNLGYVVFSPATSKIGNSWGYNGTYPSETFPSSVINMSAISGWSIIYIKSVAGSTCTISGKINGVTMSATTGGGMLIPAYTSPSNIVMATHLDGGTNYGDIIVYNSSLSAGDTTSVENYLKNKWGISY